MKARPIMPTPIKNSVDASGTDDIPTLSAKAGRGKSKKTNKNDAANSRLSFISCTPFQIPPFVYLHIAKSMQKFYFAVVNLIYINNKYIRQVWKK
jgi:hypothetical protein